MGNHYCCKICHQRYDDCVCLVAGIPEMPDKDSRILTPHLSWNESFLQELAKSKEVNEPTERFCDLIAEFTRHVYERKQDRFAWLSVDERDNMFVHACFIIIRTWDVFKPEKSNNAMAFYHTAVYGAFINYAARLRR